MSSYYAATQVTEAVDIIAVLKDNSGTLLVNASIDISWSLDDVNFTFLQTVITDSAGTATLVGAILPSPDVLHLKAAFRGTSVYAPSSGETVFDTTVLGATATSITCMVNPVLVGTTVTANVNGTLVGANGTTPITGKTIQLLLDGVSVGNAPNPTDAQGNYSAQITGISLGTHTVTAKFAGDASYTTSSSTTTFNIGGGHVSSGIGIIAVVGLAALAVVGYAVSRKKRGGR